MLCKMHMEPRRQILYNIIIPSAPKWGDIMALSEKKAITDKRHQDKLDKIKIQPYKNQGAALRAALPLGKAYKGMCCKRFKPG